MKKVVWAVVVVGAVVLLEVAASRQSWGNRLANTTWVGGFSDNENYTLTFGENSYQLKCDNSVYDDNGAYELSGDSIVFVSNSLGQMIGSLVGDKLVMPYYEYLEEIFMANLFTSLFGINMNRVVRKLQTKGLPDLWPAFSEQLPLKIAKSDLSDTAG